MITYEKIENLKNIILGEELLKRARRKKEFFTRERKITFSDIVYFTLNKRGLSLKMEMSNFEDMTGKIGNASESALCQQRQKVDPVAFKILNKEYIKNSYENEKNYKTLKGYVVTAIDGMYLEVPDVKELREEYGTSTGHGDQRKIARALSSCLYDVINNWVINAEITKNTESERTLAKHHIIELADIYAELNKEKKMEKTIIIFDRGYPSVEMIYTLQKHRIKYLFRGRKDSFRKEFENMKSKDEIIDAEITRKRLERIKDKKIKNEIKEQGALRNRFVKYRLKTGEEEMLITNLSKEEFSTQEIGELYYERWKIELAYNVAKNKLDIQNFSGQSKTIVEQEFYAQMLMMNIAEDLRKEANKKVDRGIENGYKYDYKVNMNILIGLMRKRFILIMISMTINGDEKSKKDYDNLIEEMSKNIIPIRPERSNPRNKYKGYNKYKQNLRRNS